MWSDRQKQIDYITEEYRRGAVPRDEHVEIVELHWQAALEDEAIMLFIALVFLSPFYWALGSWLVQAVAPLFGF